MKAQRIIYTALFCTIIVILIHCVIHFKIIRKVSSWYTLRLVSSLFIILLIHSKCVQSIALLFSRAVFNMNPGEKYSFSLWNHEPSDVFEITNHKTARCGWLLDAASLRCRTQQESSVLLSIFFSSLQLFSLTGNFTSNFWLTTYCESSSFPRLCVSNNNRQLGKRTRDDRSLYCCGQEKHLAWLENKVSCGTVVWDCRRFQFSAWIACNFQFFPLTRNSSGINVFAVR